MFSFFRTCYHTPVRMKPTVIVLMLLVSLATPEPTNALKQARARGATASRPAANPQPSSPGSPERCALGSRTLRTAAPWAGTGRPRRASWPA